MANPTTNFGWQMPTATDLVTDLPADFEVFGQAVDTDFVGLKGGTTGQVLAKASGTDLDFVWSADAAGMTNPMTTTADIIYSSSGSTPARLGIGSVADVLTVDGSGVPSWAAPAAPAGLNLISTTTLSAVSSQSVNSVFTSTYTNYLVVLSTTATSAAGASITMKLRASGTDSSTTYGAWLMGLNSAGTTTNNTSSSTSFYLTESHSSTTEGFNFALVNLINPNLANDTLFNVQSHGVTTAAGQFLSTSGSGVHQTATAYDGFTIIRSSGTLTGAISVYGYSK